MMRCMKYVLGLEKHSCRHKLVLDVGMGIGGIAAGLSQCAGCEVVGMDLGYAVDQAQLHFGHNSRLHIVQASLFAPPFRAGTFGMVYSQGVLHHTHSTEAAFHRISSLPEPGKGMLCVWVYSHQREEVTLFRRGLMLVEKLVRPLVSRLPGGVQTSFLVPTLPFYILYQNLYRRRMLGRENTAHYGWNEALHAARDRLTPPFSHRHTYEEVAEWFNLDKYGNLELLRDESLPANVPDNFPLAIGIRGIRQESVGCEVGPEIRNDVPSLREA
jgi:SAM-dependent methyltransferase